MREMQIGGKDASETAAKQTGMDEIGRAKKMRPGLKPDTYQGDG